MSPCERCERLTEIIRTRIYRLTTAINEQTYFCAVEEMKREKASLEQLLGELEKE